MWYIIGTFGAIIIGVNPPLALLSGLVAWFVWGD